MIEQIQVSQQVLPLQISTAGWDALNESEESKMFEAQGGEGTSR